MIPKKIHYCWFGGNTLPESVQRCLKSWKKYCPDYEIVRWDESNFDININDYVKEAYNAKRWAFVSDVARVHALIQQGGIYLDTDMELLKPLDALLDLEAFAGFDSLSYVSAGILACEKDHVLFREFLQEYNTLHFIKEDGTQDLTPNPVRLTAVCQKYGLMMNHIKQTINGLTVFPEDWFYPMDWKTRKIKITSNSYAVHHADASWLTKKEKTQEKINQLKSKLRSLLLRK